MSGRGGNNKPFKGTFTCDTEMLFPSEADWEESLFRTSFIAYLTLGRQIPLQGGGDILREHKGEETHEN